MIHPAYSMDKPFKRWDREIIPLSIHIDIFVKMFVDIVQMFVDIVQMFVDILESVC